MNISFSCRNDRGRVASFIARLVRVFGPCRGTWALRAVAANEVPNIFERERRRARWDDLMRQPREIAEGASEFAAEAGFEPVRARASTRAPGSGVSARDGLARTPE